MKTIIDELTAEEPTIKFTDEQMGELGKAANNLLDKQEEVKIAEIALKELKREERQINQQEIPQLMSNLGFESITLDDGRKITVKDSVQVAIPASIRDDAYVWLDLNGHGDLIKIALTSIVGRGEKDQAYQAHDALSALNIPSDIAESVHAGTLKTWAREELAQGHSLPQEFFKIHVVKITKVS